MDNGAAEKKPVRIIILQQPYTVLATGDPRDTEELAELVDRVMTNIAGKARNVDTARVGVLACLHLADRLRTAERELDALKRKTERLSTLLKDLGEES